ncbi:MAG: HD domain-containing phosphohydrolase [Mycobacteriales bacterium]
MKRRQAALAAVVLGTVLLPVGFGVALSKHGSAVAAVDGELDNAAQSQSQVIADHFARARSVNLLLSSNPALNDVFELPGDRQARITGGSQAVTRANNALAYLEELFPKSIGEVCLIDPTGAEAARVVRGDRAPYDDLSLEEASAPFFRPTFALEQGSVHQAAPYVSPDTNEWVVSNSTKLPATGNESKAIVHFEITVESFREAAATSSLPILIVDSATGGVVVDSRYPQEIGSVDGKPAAPLGRPDDRRFMGLRAKDTTAGRLTVGSRPASYQRLPRTPGNANDWFVVAVMPIAVGPLYGVGTWPIGIAVLALLLLVGGTIALGFARRDLVAAADNDQLTGLGNRRKLRHDLRVACRTATDQEPVLLLMFDLNGFKDYNDSFGHSAGDVLLARLGRALRASVAGRGEAYRLGGDEFCVLAPVGDGGSDALIAAASSALTERTDGHSVDASYGAVVVPTETRDVAEALHVVDQRMYTRKSGGRRSADRQTKDVLLSALYERHPDLSTRFRAVADLAAAVAERIGVPTADRIVIVQAAELHDIGKVAIPDEILDKRGALTEEEWAFVKRHSAIGERILGAAPSLAYAARLVRWANERFDGTGYPDRLAGQNIPLGSRIIAVCDAYVAMTSPRSYADPISVGDAIEELQRCSGTQFDPQVVSVFVSVVTDADHVQSRFEAIIRDY